MQLCYLMMVESAVHPYDGALEFRLELEVQVGVQLLPMAKVLESLREREADQQAWPICYSGSSKK